MLAVAQIKKALEEGYSIRNDGFFEANQENRSSAEEVAEAVLLSAQREPEERKLPYQATLLATIAIDSTIGPATSHQLVQIAEELTYQQFCILALANDTSSFDLFEEAVSSIGRLSDAQDSFLADCYYLRQRSLLQVGSGWEMHAYEIHPKALRLLQLGQRLHDAADLHAIPQTEVATRADLFTYGRGNVPQRHGPG